MANDEKMSGRLDGELTEEERAAFDAQLAVDPQSAERLARWQDNDALLRKAFDESIGAEVPERFLSAIDAGLPVARGAEFVELDNHRLAAANDNHASWWRIGGAMAASLAAGLLIGTQWMPAGNGATTSHALDAALETTPSGQLASLSTGQRLTPELSFAKSGGGYCRQFALSTGGRTQSGLACKSGGPWQIEALLPSTVTASADQGYSVAEGPNSATLDAVKQSLRGSDPLDGGEEAALIASGWE